MTSHRRRPQSLHGSDGGWEDGAVQLVLGAKVSPMSARSREVQRIVQLVAQGTSVEVVGVRWSGRSELLRQVHRTLTELGTSVLTITGTGTGAGTAAPLPLEAVRIALPPAYRKTTSEDGASAASIGDALVRYLSDGSSIVMVDDGDLLDEASWAILASAHKLLGTAVISSTLRGASTGPTDQLVSRTMHPVVQISLDELRLAELHAVLEERVDGALSPAVSARIHTKSAGIPGLALALLDGALAHGLVRRSGDQWGSGPVLWSDDMRGAYESVLYSYRHQVRDAVELLAVAGTMALTSAWALLGPELVEELEAHQLVRLSSVGVEHRPMIGVHPPGIGDYFLNQPVTARRLRIVDDAIRRLAEADAGVTAEARDALVARLRPARPVARPGAPGPGSLQSADVPVVSRMFTEAYKIHLAAARARWEESRDLKTATAYLYLQLTGANDPEEVERVVASVEPSSTDDPLVEIGWRYAHSRWLVTEGATADQAARPLTDGVAADFEHREALDTLARALRWELEALDPGFDAVLAPRAAGTGFDAQIAGIVLAACRMMAGRVDDCLAALDSIEGELRPVEAVGVGLLRGLALYATGRFTEVFEVATEWAQKAISTLDRVAFAGYSYLGALAQIALGRLDDAQDSLSVVLSSGIISRSSSFATDRAVLVAMAVISTRTGHEGAAAGFLEHAQQVLGTCDGLPLGAPGWAEAIALAGNGEPEIAAATFAEMIDDLRRRGYVLAADSATMASLIIHYDPVLAESFAGQAERLGGALFMAYLGARSAAHDRDPERLEAAAAVLQGNQATSEALKAFTFAARLYRDRGDLDGAARARTGARSVTDELGVSGLSTSGRGDHGFTARELEIIRLVAAGRTNSDIAEDLVLSVRTVESHLRNIRRKSGAVEREDIASFARSV